MIVYRFYFRANGRHVDFELRGAGKGWEVRVTIDGSLARTQQFVTLASAAEWAEDERTAMQEQLESGDGTFDS